MIRIHQVIRKIIYFNLASLGYELRKYYFIHKSKKKIRAYLNSSEQPKLNLGCFNLPLKGWLNADLFCNAEVVYIDAGEPFKLPADTFAFIYSEHLFEHLNYAQACNFIRESFRILHKGGILRIATPDLDFLNKVYSENNELNVNYLDWSVRTYFPVRTEIFDKNSQVQKVYVINNFFKAWGHQIIHNYDSLKAMLVDTGFSEIKIMKPGQSNHEIFKDIEKHGTIIPAAYNDLETMVIEARK